MLVANAGTADIRGWEDIDLASWNATLAVNLTAPFLLAQQVLPGMIERRFGRILFISSVAAFSGGVVGAHYAASKAGLHGLMHHLAPRVAADRVTVNSLAPALVGDTKMFPADLETGTPPVPIPVGRIGRPDEMADMAIPMLRNGYLTEQGDHGRRRLRAAVMSAGAKNRRGDERLREEQAMVMSASSPSTKAPPCR